MAEDKEQFQSIYGDAVSEFEAEDVSDETLSISKEAIEQELEKVEQESAAEDHDATLADDAPAESGDAPQEQPAEGKEKPVQDQPAKGSERPVAESSPEEELAAEPEQTAEISEDDGITFEDHSAGHEQDETSGDHDVENDEPEDDKVGIASYILYAVLFTIPVIGTILMLVYIIDERKNAHLRHLAQIWLVTLIIVAVGTHIALRMLGIA